MNKRIGGLVLLLAMTAAACGSGLSDTGLATLDDPTALDAATADGSVAATGDAAVAEIDAEEAMFALAECLRDQGFDVRDPEMDEDGFPRLRSMFQPLMESGDVDRETIGAAMEACSEFADAITTQFSDIDSTDREDQMFAYAECMRDNGYEMADPDFSDAHVPGQGGGPFSGLDRDDPDFQAAQEVCQDLFVGGPGGGPGGGGAPPAGA
ncbi:MAG: hypothetical protein MUP76_00935 [Acidimicrobiia bacterium]|nr:hypothetical protein [Acidimicrobiia bacterium]